MSTHSAVGTNHTNDGVAATTVESPAAVARLTRDGPAAEHIYRVLDETGGVYVEFESSWHGNNYVGSWTEGLFAFLDATRHTADSLCFESGITREVVVSQLQKATQKQSHSAYTDTDIWQTYEKPALHNWWDAGASQQDAQYVTGEFAPRSGVKTVLRAANPTTHPVYTPDGMTHAPLSTGDLRVNGTTETKWGGMVFDKFVVEGQTYAAFKQCHLKEVLPFTDVEDETGTTVESGCYHTYDGTHQLLSQDGLSTALTWFTRAGFTVSVHSAWSESAGTQTH